MHIKTENPRRRSRWLRRCAIALLLAGAAWVFHARILQCVAEVLVVEGEGGPATALAIVNEGDRRFDVARRLHREGKKTILLCRRPPDRLERLGIRVPLDELARRKLLKDS